MLITGRITAYNIGMPFIRKTRRQKQPSDIFGPIGFDVSDVYTLGSLVDAKTEAACVVETYTIIGKSTLLGKRITGASYNRIYKLINKFIARSDDKSGPSVVYSKICSNSAFEPVGVLVIKKLQGGALCNSKARYTRGKRIGQGDQASDKDALFVAKENEDLLIKQLVGTGSTMDEIYKSIVSEIKFTIRAGELGVGPKIIFSQIRSDMHLQPVGYMVMDRITGSYIKQADVIRHGSIIKKLLDKLYDGGINHGDVHNRNIILDDDGRIYIIDYGSAMPFTTGEERDYVVNITQEIGDPHSMYRPIYIN